MSKGDVNVPSKTHVPVVSVILVMLGTTFGAFGIAQIMSVFSSFSSAITNYITSKLEWNSLVSGVVVGIIFLVFAVVVFYFSSKSKEWSNRFKDVMASNIDRQPKNFYAMSTIPTEYIINHMVEKRNCKSVEDPDGKGFAIYCSDYPTSPYTRAVIRGEEDRFSKGTKIAVIIFINIAILIPAIMIYEGSMDIIYGPWAWYVFLIVGILVFYESELLPMWSLVLMYVIHMLITIIVSPEILVVVKIAVPGAIILFGFTLILYIFKYPHCEKEKNWWCDRL